MLDDQFFVKFFHFPAEQSTQLWAYDLYLGLIFFIVLLSFICA